MHLTPSVHPRFLMVSPCPGMLGVSPEISSRGRASAVPWERAGTQVWPGLGQGVCKHKSQSTQIRWFFRPVTTWQRGRRRKGSVPCSVPGLVPIRPRCLPDGGALALRRTPVLVPVRQIQPLQWPLDPVLGSQRLQTPILLLKIQNKYSLHILCTDKPTKSLFVSWWVSWEKDWDLATPWILRSASGPWSQSTPPMWVSFRE